MKSNYAIFSSYNSAELDRLVNNALKCGFELQGGVAMVYRPSALGDYPNGSDSYILYCQACYMPEPWWDRIKRFLSIHNKSMISNDKEAGSDAN